MESLFGVTDFQPFRIGTVLFGRPAVQAPLDGFSDSAFRRITHELGSPVSYTEFINGLDVVHNAPNIPKRIAFHESERPIAFQLFDDDPQRLIDSAAILEERCHPDLFDINMGCSARKVANRGAGAGLLKHPEKIAAMVSGTVKRVSVPVTVKIRLGWDEDSINYLEVGKIAQDNGASLVALHARTRAQQYDGQADWSAIAALKQALQIPVIGNGDVNSAADVRRMFRETGCDAVMIGRAAVYDPWIFSGLDLDDVPDELFRTYALKHFEYQIEEAGPEWGCVIFRKYAKRYLTRIGVEKDLILSLLTTDDPEYFRTKYESLMRV